MTSAQSVQAGANVAEWPIRLRSVANLREHWAVKADRVRKQREDVWKRARATLTKPTLPCVITITRIGPRLFDVDNNVAAMKAVIDSLAQWIGVDDRDQRIEWRFAQEKRSKTYAVRVAVEEVRS